MSLNVDCLIFELPKAGLSHGKLEGKLVIPV